MVNHRAKRAMFRCYLKLLYSEMMHMIGQMWWDATFGLNSVTPKLVSQARARPCFAPTQPRCHTNPAASPEHVLSTEASVSYPSGHLGSLESPSQKVKETQQQQKTKMKSKSASYFLHLSPETSGTMFSWLSISFPAQPWGTPLRPPAPCIHHALPRRKRRRSSTWWFQPPNGASSHF